MLLRVLQIKVKNKKQYISQISYEFNFSPLICSFHQNVNGLNWTSRRRGHWLRVRYVRVSERDKPKLDVQIKKAREAKKIKNLHRS